MAVGAAIAAGRFSRDPMSLLQRGGELLGSPSVLGQVSGLSKPLAAAGKAAAAGVVSRQIDSMGDRIKRRTDALRPGDEKTEPEDDEQVEPDERGADEHSGNGRAKPSGRNSGADADEEYDEDDYDDVDDEDQPEEQEEPRRPTRRRAPQAKTDDGDGSQARRAGRAAPVRRRVSNR